MDSLLLGNSKILSHFYPYNNLRSMVIQGNWGHTQADLSKEQALVEYTFSCFSDIFTKKVS